MKTSNRIIQALCSDLWAITPAALENIIDIANRNNEAVEAVEKKLGKKLENAQTTTVRGNTAIIPISGPIFRYANLFTQVSGATSIEILARDFNEALENDAVENIVLEIDSPGGQVAGVSEFADMVKQSSKPVTAYVSDLAASAAYWIASAADDIAMSKTAMVGSIGVVATLKTGKDSDTVEIVSSQSPNKRPDLETSEGRAEVQKNIDDLGKIFVETVASNRGVDEETVLTKFGKGGLLVGAKAVKAGMADRLSSFEKELAGLSGANSNKGAVIMKQDEKVADNSAPDLNADTLKQNNPDLYAEILAKGKEEGAQAERERIQGVEAQSIPGFESVVESCKYDGSTTGADVAVKIIAAQKKQMEDGQASLSNNAPQPVDVVDEPDQFKNADNKSMNLEERAAHEWSQDASLSDEFSCVESYTEYLRGMEDGSIRILK